MRLAVKRKPIPPAPGRRDVVTRVAPAPWRAQVGQVALPS